MVMRAWNGGSVPGILTQLFEGAPTSVGLTASTHWVGGNFIAPVTDTISTIHWFTGSITAAVCTAEIAITNVDSSGFPLGTDIAVSDSRSSFSTSTHYSQTISAAVTAGTLYGIILRLTAYTSGTLAVRARSSACQAWHGQTGNYPFASANTGSTAAYATTATFGLTYASAGKVFTLGLCAPWSNAVFSTGAASGNVAGNKFTVDRPMRVVGYTVNGDLDNVYNVEMYAGTDNTAISGSSITGTVAHRVATTSDYFSYWLPTPITLLPGTYRVGVRLTSASANSIFDNTFGASGFQSNVPGATTYQKTAYASGAWTDTATAIASVCPVFDASDNGPAPSLNIGGLY